MECHVAHNGVEALDRLTTDAGFTYTGSIKLNFMPVAIPNGVVIEQGVDEKGEANYSGWVRINGFNEF